MITIKAAQLIVERELNKSSDEIDRLIVFDHLTHERGWGMGDYETRLGSIQT